MKKNPSPTARVFLSLLSIVVLLFSQLAAQLLAEFSVSFGSCSVGKSACRYSLRVDCGRQFVVALS